MAAAEQSGMDWGEIQTRQDSLDDVFVKLVNEKGESRTLTLQKIRKLNLLKKSGGLKVVSGKRIFSDFKVFSRGYLRNRFGLFFGLIFPVILILIFGAIFSSGSSGTLNVYTQNKDTGPFAAPQMDIASQFLKALNSSTTIRVITVNASADFSKYLADHSASDGIIIPENFSADYLAGHQVNLTVIEAGMWSRS